MNRRALFLHAPYTRAPLNSPETAAERRLITLFMRLCEGNGLFKLLLSLLFSNCLAGPIISSPGVTALSASGVIMNLLPWPISVVVVCSILQSLTSNEMWQTRQFAVDLYLEGEDRATQFQLGFCFVPRIKSSPAWSSHTGEPQRSEHDLKDCELFPVSSQWWPKSPAAVFWLCRIRLAGRNQEPTVQLG